jgi:hypothetical protein
LAAGTALTFAPPSVTMQQHVRTIFDVVDARASVFLSEFPACSFGLSATSQQYFSLRTNQPPTIRQQHFSLRTNQHQPSATSQTNMLMRVVL